MSTLNSIVLWEIQFRFGIDTGSVM